VVASTFPDGQVEGEGLWLEKGAPIIRVREGGFPTLRAHFSGRQRLDILERGQEAHARLTGAPDEVIAGRVQSVAMVAVTPEGSKAKTATQDSETSADRDLLAKIEVTRGMELGKWPAGLTGHVRLFGENVPAGLLLYENIEQAVRYTARRLRE
jgi:hypothetical protein